MKGRISEVYVALALVLPSVDGVNELRDVAERANGWLSFVEYIELAAEAFHSVWPDEPGEFIDAIDAYAAALVFNGITEPDQMAEVARGAIASTE